MADSEDLAALQGTWVQVAVEVDGAVDPANRYGLSTITTFHDRHFAVREADGTLLLEGTFTLDSSTTPRSITWTDTMGRDSGKQLLAIYTLDADQFRFVAARPGTPRPTAFATVPGQTMRTFVRTPLSGSS